jgi:hypothetical protein
MNMMNFIGLIAALCTFSGIWFGHVFVRKLEAKIAHLKPIIFSCLLVGLGLEVTSILVDKNLVSTVFGIVGITILWDALEFIRQEKRVQKGYAPANPYNPRHAAILANFPSATTVNLTARNPRGYPYSDEEIEMLLQTGKLEKRGESE